MKDNTAAQLEDITKKYLHEQTQRKLLYNKVQELRGNIRVFCRVRFDDRSPCIFQFPSDTEAIVQKLQGGTELYEFEHVYGPDSKQEKVFQDTKPIILSCVDGYNVCIMAYGQTGSGKTYTMMGPPDNPGVNRRAVRELLDLCNSREEVEYEIKVSLMEVYNEKIFDLLTADRSKDLKIHASPQGTYVGGLIERSVKTQEDVFEVMATGDKHRSVGATQMNTDSSRSHLLLQLSVTGYNTISKASTTGKLTLVDLAGSERVSKTDASGERLVEAAAINKSLTCLGQVFKALASSSPHIPYRNSKLTHALQDSLGGDSKTAIFVNMSPLESNLSETHMTLKFGQNIRKIELGPATKKKGPPRPKK
jgi:kinesin family protein C2/C3